MPTTPSVQATDDVEAVFAAPGQEPLTDYLTWPSGASKAIVLARSADTTFALKSASDSTDSSTRLAILNQTVKYGPIKETEFAGLALRAFSAGTVVVSFDVVDET